MKNKKLLYGQLVVRASFDRRIRFRGKRAYVGQKGSEFFLVNGAGRIFGISKTRELAIANITNGWKYYGAAVSQGAFRLHNIEGHNEGRCSKAECKAIFDSFKKKEGK